MPLAKNVEGHPLLTAMHLRGPNLALTLRQSFEERDDEEMLVDEPQQRDGGSLVVHGERQRTVGKTHLPRQRRRLQDDPASAFPVASQQQLQLPPPYTPP